MPFAQRDLALILNNRDQSLLALDKYESEKSLLGFIRCGWKALEPGQSFVSNWGLEAICDHLEAVTRGEIKRLLINVPPGCTKSMSTNVFWPAWEWGPIGLPHYRYISFSHEQNLATRDNVRCRNLIQSEWYQALWGDQFGFKHDQNAKVYYENDKTGWRQSCAARSLTGRRGDRVIGDDPHSVHGADSDAEREEVLQICSETVPTRLNNQAESAIVYIMQRVHERDVSGLILSSEMDYEHLMLPMEFESSRRCYSIVKPSYIKNPKLQTVYYDNKEKAWSAEKPEKVVDIKSAKRYNVDKRKEDGELLDPKRFPKQAVEELKSALRSWGGTYAEAGQLQQRPAPRGGGMFQRDDFQYADNLKDFKFRRIVRGWDFAASDRKQSPYTVGVKMGLTIENDIVIIDVERFRKRPGAVERSIKATATSDGRSVFIDMPQDPGQAGKSQKAAFAKLLHGFNVSFSPESGSKEQRANPLSAQCEAGNVVLLRAPWNDVFIQEAAVFPNGEFKDQIDAASRAYSNLIRKRKRRTGSAPKTIETEQESEVA